METYLANATEAEAVLLEAGDIQNVHEPFAALLGLAINCVFVEAMRRGQEPVCRMKRAEILKLCVGLLEHPDWQPSSQWPFTKPQMEAAFMEGFGDIVPLLVAW